MTYAHGLGEMLRYLSELVDSGSEKTYPDLPVNYRSRYTPVLRAIVAGATTVTEIKSVTFLTQGAVSQTVALMEQDGIVERQPLADGRKNALCLTPRGRSTLSKLELHWHAIFQSASELEKETGVPLMAVLEKTINALSTRSAEERIRDAKAELQKRKKKSMPGESDAINWFSTGGENYSQYRPKYTRELVDYLANLAPDNRKALDVGCGTGQLTRLLSDYFTAVTGVDPSEDQLLNASAASGITYIHSSAENLPADFSGYSLITVAQAAHWFRLDDFYREVRRVAAPGAIIALISYGVLNIEGETGERFRKFYYEDIGHFWPSERKLVDSGYRELNFPFEELQAMPLTIEASWSMHELLGYISTWSAVRQAEQKGEMAIIRQFADDLATVWGEPDERRKVSWPINMRIGRLASPE